MTHSTSLNTHFPLFIDYMLINVENAPKQFAMVEFTYLGYRTEQSMRRKPTMSFLPTVYIAAPVKGAISGHGRCPSSMRSGYHCSLLANYISNSKYNLLSRKYLYFELYLNIAIPAISIKNSK